MAIQLEHDTFTIKVTGLSENTNLDDLYYVFKKFGKVANINVPYKIRKHGSIFVDRGKVTVHYFRHKEAEDAITALHEKEIDGAKLSLMSIF